MKKYIEIVQHGVIEKVVKRIDVTSESERTIDKIETGLNINLNHESYFTRVIESETTLAQGSL